MTVFKSVCSYQPFDLFFVSVPAEFPLQFGRGIVVEELLVKDTLRVLNYWCHQILQQILVFGRRNSIQAISKSPVLVFQFRQLVFGGRDFRRPYLFVFFTLAVGNAVWVSLSHRLLFGKLSL